MHKKVSLIFYLTHGIPFDFLQRDIFFHNDLLKLGN